MIQVYFITTQDRSRIKIGVSRDIESRMYALKEGHGDLICLGSVPGGFWLEKKIHAHLNNYRIRGEWFSASAEVVRFIDSILRDGHNFGEEPPLRSSERRSGRARTIRFRLKKEIAEKVQAQADRMTEEGPAIVTVSSLVAYFIKEGLDRDGVFA